jgi:hypothetical protein
MKPSLVVFPCSAAKDGVALPVRLETLRVADFVSGVSQRRPGFIAGIKASSAAGFSRRARHAPVPRLTIACGAPDTGSL